MNKLTSFGDKNVSYYLYRIDQNYRQALEYFINGKEMGKLIPFIYELLADIQVIDKGLRDKKFADIKQFLVKNIGLLFKINKF